MNLKQCIKDTTYRFRQDIIDDILKRISLPKEAKFLDVGCAEGNASLRHAESAGIKKENIFGLDIDDKYLEIAKEKFKVFKVDFEKDSFPFEDNYFDLILVDQVFEHIKNISNLSKEISRVLKPNGYLIVLTPNLAVWYNRFLLLSGKQPLCINIFSDHIRGFTKRALKEFILNDIKGSKAISFRGAGFYPFWGYLAKIFSKIFPNLSVYLIFLFQIQK
ncbi:MAG: class I SAM-dependent methyltransferase [Candidatus Nealsonbacteria bacterium]